MKFSYFYSVKAARGHECTYNDFVQLTQNQIYYHTIAAIRHTDPKETETIASLKKQLPIICWQAYFEGKRVAREAQPSGLFMLDIDHVEQPSVLYNSRIAGHNAEYGIVLVHVTPSGRGLRLVAKCRPELRSIAECQKWLADKLGVEYDEVCKDFARSSFICTYQDILMMDAKAIWQDAPAVVYRVEDAVVQPVQTSLAVVEEPKEQPVAAVTDFDGISLADLAVRWLRATGGEPVPGQRNARLYKLALRLRYLVDFSEENLSAIIPSYGLPPAELRQLSHQAVNAPRSADMPKDMQEVINLYKRQQELADGEEVEDDTRLDERAFELSDMPELPPVFNEIARTAPEDFKKAVVLCQLPILGALASKLRATYLDGQVHSPSFQVSLEAPQASGKSFMRRLVDLEFAQVIEHDEEQRQKEREYDAKVREMKLLNIKINKENKQEVLGERPKTLIRFVPATMSITKLLMRMEAAKGLHLFAFCEEVDTIAKAFKRGFSSYSDLLRVSFDNGLYGQDYATENSFSGIIPIYYNLLTSGTPKAMRRFYPDVEDGLVSRVLFVSLPDQFGKPMPDWKKLTEEESIAVTARLVDLNEVSIVGDDVQKEHHMNMEFCNKALQEWILGNQQVALRDNDRTRDIFCRRAAVVGFRAAMLAFFLYGETLECRKKVSDFAIWVADCMLVQHLLRFAITTNNDNTKRYPEVFDALPNEFSREELRSALNAAGVSSTVRNVIYQWRLGGFVEIVRQTTNRKTAVSFKKTGV